MTLYTRHQLLLVLLLAGAAGGGLAVDHRRRASPELAARLEMLDRAERPPAPVAARRPARLAAESDRAVQAARERTETPVDVNRASEVELTALPGIGPALAARIHRRAPVHRDRRAASRARPPPRHAGAVCARFVTAATVRPRPCRMTGTCARYAECPCRRWQSRCRGHRARPVAAARGRGSIGGGGARRARGSRRAARPPPRRPPAARGGHPRRPAGARRLPGRHSRASTCRCHARACRRRGSTTSRRAGRPSARACCSRSIASTASRAPGRVQLTGVRATAAAGEGQRDRVDARLAGRGFRNPGDVRLRGAPASRRHPRRRHARAERDRRARRSRAALATRAARGRWPRSSGAAAGVGGAARPACSSASAAAAAGDRRAFRRAGVYHVLAVSGFNVALIAAPVVGAAARWPRAAARRPRSWRSSS